MSETISTNEMVERVARAICESCGRDADDTNGGPHPIGPWLDEGEPWWTGCIDAARAAIACEPTEAMIKAGQLPIDLSSPGASFIPSRDVLRRIWRAMADAALKET